MSILKDQSGQFNMMINSIIGLIVLAIMLLFALPLLNSLVGTIIGGNMSSFSMSSTIVMIVGMFGILAVGIPVMAWIMGIFSPQQPGQIGGF